VAIHVSIDGLTEDTYPSVAEFMERIAALKPASITVDAGGTGRMLIAAMQTRGLPATALEKRPRPVLSEIQRIEELSREVKDLKATAEARDLETRLLREHQRQLRILIDRLE
jgi:hypothetical protein